MSIKKTVAIAAAAGALAAISVPAMALENEFHGFYQIKGFVSNYNDAAAANVTPSLIDAKANNYAEQRARIFYTGKTSADLKLVTAFELDTRWGGVTNGKYNGSSDSGVLDGDGISLETKWVYLDFNATDKVNIKTGLMPYKDSIKGLFVDADVNAIYTTTKLDALTLGVGYSRLSDLNVTNDGLAAGHLGDSATDLLLVDASYAVNKDLKVGASYYLLEDYQTKFGTQTDTLLLSTLAANAEAKLGPATVSGFAGIQFGERDKSKVKNQGYALNLAAKMPVASGTAKAAVLYTSGDKTTTGTKNEGWVGTSVQSYNESGLMLLVRNNATSGTTTTNEFLRRAINNVGLVSAGYDAKISDKTYANANLGLAWAPEKGNQKSSYMGTELALEGGYKVFDNLTASVQAAYVVLGDYYKANVAGAKLPDNPYTARLVLTHTF